MAEVSIAIASLAGLASFLAPCILPMVPAFLAYISGTTITELSTNRGSAISVKKTNVVLNSVFFVLGFSLVFSVLGIIINGVLSTGITELVSTFNLIGGSIIAGFGVF